MLSTGSLPPKLDLHHTKPGFPYRAWSRPIEQHAARNSLTPRHCSPRLPPLS